MTWNAWAAVLTTLVLPLAPRAAEPYRPLPRMPADEVDRRADEQPPPPPPAPGEEGVAAPGAGPSQGERAPASAGPNPGANSDLDRTANPNRTPTDDDDEAPLPPIPPPLAAEPPPARPEPPATAARPPPPGTPRAPTLETFRAALSPFGTWERWSGYGWVWRPDVAADWRPYVHGEWIWNERAWSWASEEPWGWATYHYGRWTYDPSAGWAWVPGLEWAPAWVTWRFDGAVVGWAPLFPGAGSWAAEHPSARLWTFVPRAKFRTGVPVARAAYAPRHFDALWARFAGRGARPAAQR